jgi:hypothetical protein
MDSTHRQLNVKTAALLALSDQVLHAETALAIAGAKTGLAIAEVQIATASLEHLARRAVILETANAG